MKEPACQAPAQKTIPIKVLCKMYHTRMFLIKTLRRCRISIRMPPYQGQPPQMQNFYPNGLLIRMLPQMQNYLPEWSLSECSATAEFLPEWSLSEYSANARILIKSCSLPECSVRCSPSDTPGHNSRIRPRLCQWTPRPQKTCKRKRLVFRIFNSLYGKRRPANHGRTPLLFISYFSSEGVSEFSSSPKSSVIGSSSSFMSSAAASASGFSASFTVFSCSSS